MNAIADCNLQVSMIEPGNFLAGTSLFNDKIIEASANDMWNYMSDEVRSFPIGPKLHRNKWNMLWRIFGRDLNNEPLSYKW